MQFISNLSTYVLVIIIKSQEKIKPVKGCYLNFNLNGHNFSECKNQDFMSFSSRMLNLQRVLFCTGIDLNDIMQIDCLAYMYFVFYRFSLVGYIIQYFEVCYYRGTHSPQKISPINIYQKSEFLKFIISRINL